MNIYERVKKLCETRSMTVNSLEIELAIGKGVISRWRTTTPTMKNIISVANYFDVSVDYLFCRTDISDSVEKLIREHEKKASFLKEFDLTEKESHLVREFTRALLYRT